MCSGWPAKLCSALALAAWLSNAWLGSSEAAEVGVHVHGRPATRKLTNHSLIFLQAIQRCPKDLWKVHFDETFAEGEAILQLFVPHEQQVRANSTQ